MISLRSFLRWSTKRRFHPHRWNGGDSARFCARDIRNLPFAWDAKTISGGLNFTLTTDLGDVDLFSEVAGSETYSDVLPDSFDVEAFGVQFKCMDLPTLIRIKEAAGRPKDREALAELRVLLEEQKRMRR